MKEGFFDKTNEELAARVDKLATNLAEGFKAQAVTNERLAVEIKNLSNRMDKRFEQMEDHFNRCIDTVMSVMVDGFTRIGHRFDNLEKEKCDATIS